MNMQTEGKNRTLSAVLNEKYVTCNSISRPNEVKAYKLFTNIQPIS
jgi:hypothetical protein